MSARFSQASAASSEGSRPLVCGPSGSASATGPVGPSCADTGPTCPAGRMCANSSNATTFAQLMFSAEEIPALPVHGPKATALPSTPISPDSSLPWSADCAHGGWSARMFLHQMLAISRPHWTSSATESWLSSWTLGTSQLRVAGGSSLSDAMLPIAPDSPDLYLTPRMVRGLLRRALGRRRPLQRVLLRTPQGWRRRTVTCSSRGEGFAVSIPPSVNYSKGSPRGWTAGLSRSRRRTMLGNAVNVGCAEWIGRRLMAWEQR